MKIKAMLFEETPQGLRPITTALWLTPNQAASVLGVSNKTIYRLIESGALRAVRHRWVFRIAAEDLKRYMEHAEDWVPEFERRMRAEDLGLKCAKGAGHV